MEQYISKFALVAEIEKRISRNKKRKEWEDIPEKRHQLIIEGQLLGELKHFLDSLEVKEVDLENEISKYIAYNICPPSDKVKKIAKHFFELGLRSIITEEDCKLIWNIGDEIPNMPEEEFFKELLKRYKAQKGE